jgi:hypothetical protein
MKRAPRVSLRANRSNLVRNFENDYRLNNFVKRHAFCLVFCELMVCGNRGTQGLAGSVCGAE